MNLLKEFTEEMSRLLLGRGKNDTKRKPKSIGRNAWHQKRVHKRKSIKVCFKNIN